MDRPAETSDCDQADIVCRNAHCRYYVRPVALDFGMEYDYRGTSASMSASCA